MKVLVINGSPVGENSITLQTVLYIRKYNPDDEFRVLHVGKQIKKIEREFEKYISWLEKADLILFCYPVYTFLVPAQLHRFIELIKEYRVNLTGKYATQITTSKHFYDVTAHRFIQDNCDDLRMRSVRGLSADMQDLLSPKGQKEALDFFRFVKWCFQNQVYEPAFCSRRGDAFLKKAAVPERLQKTENQGRIALVTDAGQEGSDRLQTMIDRFIRVYPDKVTVVNLNEITISGGCLGCFRCAADGNCIYKDGFSEVLRNLIQTADAVVYAFTIKDHSMGSRFKLYDDRQFCNGHRTVTMGKPVGYLVDGFLGEESNLKLLMEARAQVGGNYYAGAAGNEENPDREIDQLAASLHYAVRNHYQQPGNFYGVGGMKIFRDLIYEMQGLMKEDHRFYKEHGFYDFPQKHKGMILGMYLVGSMMNSRTLGKMMGTKMTEGMLRPYRRVLERN